MKQNITKEQLNELSLNMIIKLSEWVNPDSAIMGLSKDQIIEIIPLLSIGEMIEILSVHYYKPNERTLGLLNRVIDEGLGFKDAIFCDVLWRAVKEVLESPEDIRIKRTLEDVEHIIV